MKLFKNNFVVPISMPTNFPSGIAVKTPSGVYWIKDGKRFKLISDRAAQSWLFTTVIAEDSALSGIKLVGKLGFRDGTLIKNISDSKIYLISQNKRRHITDPDTFTKYGFDKNVIVEVSDYEVNVHELGDSL